MSNEREMNEQPSRMAEEEANSARQDRVNEEVRSRDLHDVVGLISQVVEKMASIERSSTGSGSKNDSAVDQHLKVFQNFKPPTFKGACEPTVADDWILRIGKILDGMICPDNRKVVLATFMLEGEAERWWQTQHREKFDLLPLPMISGDAFVKVFRDWFISASARLALQDKFFNLTQGVRTVMQYEAEFTSLSRYAPHYVSTAEEKCHRFLRGLRDQLRLALAPFDIGEFPVLVERARRIENELNFSRSTGKQIWEHSEAQLAEKKRPYDRGDRRDNFKNKQFRPNEKQKQVQFDKPRCVQCGKQHLGPCFKGTGRCFTCGEVGHRRADCPMEKRNVSAQGY